MDGSKVMEACRIKVLYSQRTVEDSKGRERLGILEENECPAIAGAVDKCKWSLTGWQCHINVDFLT